MTNKNLQPKRCVGSHIKMMSPTCVPAMTSITHTTSARFLACYIAATSPQGFKKYTPWHCWRAYPTGREFLPTFRRVATPTTRSFPAATASTV